ncbi:MAG: Hpt domain-containing protein [Cupriavidus sp.]|nr:Hpt domain-containing protein [Cupriavidus sp.]
MTPSGTPSVLTAEECRAFGPALANAARDDLAVYHMLLTRLLDANTTDLVELRHAVDRRDWPGVHRSVHRLKGSAALARCPTLVAAGKSIESAAGHGKAAVVNALLPRYVAIVAEFNDQLQKLRGDSRLAQGTFKEFEEAVHPPRVQAPDTAGTL